MTPAQNTRKQALCAPRCAAAHRWVWGAILWLLWWVPALGQVALEYTVQRAELVVGESGETSFTLVDVDRAFAGDRLRYTITFTNNGVEEVPAGGIIVTCPIPSETVYLEDTAAGDDTLIEFSRDGETFVAADDLALMDSAGVAPAEGFNAIRWTYELSLNPAESASVWFDVSMQAPEATSGEVPGEPL